MLLCCCFFQSPQFLFQLDRQCIMSVQLYRSQSILSCFNTTSIILIKLIVIINKSCLKCPHEELFRKSGSIYFLASVTQQFPDMVYIKVNSQHVQGIYSFIFPTWKEQLYKPHFISFLYSLTPGSKNDSYLSYTIPVEITNKDYM